MADELEGELAPEADAPGQFVAKRRRRHPIWDVGVLVLAIACVVSAIVVVEQIRGSRVNAPDQSAVASDGFTPIKLGVTISGRSGIGDNAPTFRLNNPEGTLVSLSELRGKPVVLNFWATWCVPCRREIPDLEALQTELGDSVVIVGVDLNEPASVVSDFAKSMQMTYTLALDLDGSVTAAYRLTGLPETFFLDAEGVIRDHRIGQLRPAVARCVVSAVMQGHHDPGNCR
ncbi:MAG: TlpA disulfide reductase family protein [Tepidiformaceae bacterium]